MKNYTDLTGQKFGRLTVIGRVEDKLHPGGQHSMQWLCQCECGNKASVCGYSLKRGDTQSCGCLQKELLSQRAKKHGKSNDRLFWIWRDMKLRCHVSSNISYENYGGRGIKVCEEWLGERGSENFIDWALANGYRDDLEIDRKDPNGNYEPLNCRWVTPKEQANNRRNNRFLEYNGKRQTMKQWAEELGLNYSTLKMRINTYHWNIEKALTTPTQKHKAG